MSPSRVVCCVPLLVVLLRVGASCASMPALDGQAGSSADQLGKRPAFRCGSTRPLVVDWDSTDRATLEARVHRGLVVVHDEGRSMQVLPRCFVRTDADYGSIGVTPKADRVEMGDASELYANIPVQAAEFEGKLAQSGMPRADMTVVGQWDTARAIPRRDELEGDCDGATHVVTSLTVGAFEFLGKRGAEAAGAEVVGVGGGVKSSSSQEVLNRDGSPTPCRLVRQGLYRADGPRLSRPRSAHSGRPWRAARRTPTPQSRCRGRRESRVHDSLHARAQAAPLTNVRRVLRFDVPSERQADIHVEHLHPGPAFEPNQGRGEPCAFS